jgi:hypothetical protein
MVKLGPTPSRAEATLTVPSRTKGTVATFQATHYVNRRSVTGFVMMDGDGGTLQCQADGPVGSTATHPEIPIFSWRADHDMSIGAGERVMPRRDLVPEDAWLFQPVRMVLSRKAAGRSVEPAEVKGRFMR